MELADFEDDGWTVEAWADEELAETSLADMPGLAESLRALQLSCSREEEQSVFSNYSAFIRTAKEIAALQGDMTRCRELLSGLSAVLAALRAPAAAEPAPRPLHGPHSALLALLAAGAQGGEGDGSVEALTELTERLEVQLAEAQLAEAAETLQAATRALAAAVSEAESEEEGAGERLAAALSAQRERLAALLSAELRERGTPAARRRAAAQGLVRLGAAAAAYEGLLRHHSARLEEALRPLRPPRAGDAQGGCVYAAEASGAVCDRLARAAADAAAAFPAERARASQLVAWAAEAVARWAALLQAEGAPMGAGAALREAAAAARVALAHARLLEPFGLAVAPQLARLLRGGFSASLEAELEKGLPGPRLLTAAEAYLRGGSSEQLEDVACALCED